MVNSQYTEPGERWPRPLARWVLPAHSRVLWLEGNEPAVVALCRVLDGVARHQWEGRVDGPTGPEHMPAPMGRLIDRDGRAAA